jgi:hypothetical protein
MLWKNYLEEVLRRRRTDARNRHSSGLSIFAALEVTLLSNLASALLDVLALVAG